jgi:hypothetical protein
VVVGRLNPTVGFYGCATRTTAGAVSHSVHRSRRRTGYGGRRAEPTQELNLKSSTKDQAAGTFHDVKGHVKEAAGQIDKVLDK